MDKEWSNKSFNESIDSIYNNFQKEMSSIVSNFCDIKYDKKIIQILPNQFNLSGIVIECKLEDDQNLITIDFPKVTIFNGKIYLSIEKVNLKIGQYLYFKFLDEKFDHSAFCKQIGESVNAFTKDYSSLILKNFDQIRTNYFSNSNRLLSKYEVDFFIKPCVLLKCETSEEISHHGYKPGEGRNYEHSYSVKYVDIHNFENKKVTDYLKLLNDSNPKDCDKEYLEMNASNFYDSLQTEYFDLELSKKINHYIQLNEEHKDKFDFQDIKYEPIIKKNRNNFITFECIILTFVITTFDIEKIELFFKSTKSKDRNYQNIALLSQYFLNTRYSSTRLIAEFYHFREKIISELNLNNFGNNESYNEVLSSFKSIGGTEKDLEKLMYFYMNFTSKYYRDIDYNHVAYIFNKYFKTENFC